MRTVFQPELFSGQNALVTGGGSGIGLRIARELVQLGARVVLAGRNEQKLQTALASFGEHADQVRTVACDILDESSVEQCVSRCVAELGPIHLLVNNAGGQFPSKAEDIKPKGWRAVVETNLTGPFLVSREVFLQSMGKHGGSIVNILMNMRNGFPLMAHSGAARAGAANLTRTLAVEWGRHGVRVNAVAPGIIATSGLDTYAPEFRKVAVAAAANNQATRLGTEAETAAAVLFLLCEAAAFITGQVLYVDGGESLYAPLYPPVSNDRWPAFDD